MQACEERMLVLVRVRSVSALARRVSKRNLLPLLSIHVNAGINVFRLFASTCPLPPPKIRTAEPIRLCLRLSPSPSRVVFFGGALLMCFPYFFLIISFSCSSADHERLHADARAATAALLLFRRWCSSQQVVQSICHARPTVPRRRSWILAFPSNTSVTSVPMRRFLCWRRASFYPRARMHNCMTCDGVRIYLIFSRVKGEGV